MVTTLKAAQTWAAEKWEVLEMPPTPIEKEATRFFFETGQDSSRVLALIHGVNAMATSGVMAISNLSTGLSKGVSLLGRCQVVDGFSTMGVGVCNATRSAYNVMHVFVIAAFGLVPILNPIVYSSMPEGLKLKPIAPVVAAQPSAGDPSQELVTARQRIQDLEHASTSQLGTIQGLQAQLVKARSERPAAANDDAETLRAENEKLTQELARQKDLGQKAGQAAERRKQRLAEQTQEIERLKKAAAESQTTIGRLEHDKTVLIQQRNELKEKPLQKPAQPTDGKVGKVKSKHKQ